MNDNEFIIEVFKYVYNEAKYSIDAVIEDGKFKWWYEDTWSEPITFIKGDLETEIMVDCSIDIGGFCSMNETPRQIGCNIINNIDDAREDEFEFEKERLVNEQRKR